MLDVERELYRDRYASEMERRAQINDRVDSMFNLLALLTGVLLFLFSYNDLTLQWCRYCYWGMLVSSIVMLAVGAFEIYRMFMSDQALYIPDPVASHQYHRGLLPVEGDDGKVDFVKSLIADQIAHDYLETSQVNAERNDGRERRLRKAKILFSLALAAIIVAVVPLSVDYVKKPISKDMAHGQAGK